LLGGRNHPEATSEGVHQKTNKRTWENKLTVSSLGLFAKNNKRKWGVREGPEKAFSHARMGLRDHPLGERGEENWKDPHLKH